jgi:hypothetical protein
MSTSIKGTEVRLERTEEECKKINTQIIPQLSRIDQTLTAVYSSINALEIRLEKTEEESKRINTQIIPNLVRIDHSFGVLNNSFLKLELRLERNEQECRKIDMQIAPQITTINQSVSVLSKSVSILTQSLYTLTSSFNGFVIHLQTKGITFDAQLFITQSPIRLTIMALEILKKIEGDKFIDENLKELMQAMDKHWVKTALDVQSIAPLVISGCSGHDNFNDIKNFIFNNPIYRTTNSERVPIELHLNISVVAQIMGVYLRDKYLELHPELDPDAPTAGNLIG